MQIKFEVSSKRFFNIPSSPLAYWVSEKIIDDFANGESITKYVDSFQGIITGDNTKFLRLWFELNINKEAFHKKNMDEIDLTNQYWIPYNKGGDLKKWYGNQDYVINWRFGPDDKTRGKKTFQDYYLREYVAWSYIATTTLATRYFPEGFLWDVAGSGIFDKSGMLYYLQMLIASKVGITFLQIINPTINYQVENILMLPVIVDNEKKNIVDDFVKENISLSRTDWDSFETSWDFKKHPLI